MTETSRIEALLISPDGMLGHAWQQLLQQRGIAHRGLSFPAIDLTKPETIRDAITPSTTLVINCAAYTDVDGAEQDEAAATAINGTGVGTLAERCREVDATLLHYSTDYVFQGQANEPYPTDAPRVPVNAYGRSKAVGEQAIERSGARHLIVRTSWLYAPWGNNFVLTMRHLSQARPTLRVVDDQRGRPTSCTYLAQRSLALIEKGAEGVRHVTDGGECTWYSFTREIVRQVGGPCEVTPCSSDEFPRPAPRPAYSVLDLSETEAQLGPSTPWQDNLRAVLDTASEQPA